MTRSESLLIANATRLLHNLTTACLESVDREILRESLIPFIHENDWIYITQSVFENAREIFDDLIQISYLADDIRVVQGSFTESLFKYLEIEIKTTNSGVEGQQVTGINYKDLGYYVGDVLGRTTVDFN